MRTYGIVRIVLTADGFPLVARRDVVSGVRDGSYLLFAYRSAVSCGSMPEEERMQMIPLVMHAVVQLVHLILTTPHVLPFVHQATPVAQDATPGMIFKVLGACKYKVEAAG
jgi:hypothetical protein